MAAHPTAGGVAPLYSARTPYHIYCEELIINRLGVKRRYLVSDCFPKYIHGSSVCTWWGALHASLNGIEAC
jgi:hypothetical protein